jgi:hypothetical protein
MSRVERDPERGRAVAAELKRLGAKRILIRAAEQGYITELACKMPKCFCPEELGRANYFAPATAESRDWKPTFEHFPLPKRDGGKETVDNAVLAHRLCNRMDYSIIADRSHARDLERIRKARKDAIRRNNEGPDALTPEQPAEKPARKKRAKKPSAWAVLKSEGTAAEVAEHLLSHETLGDVTWADRPERQGGVERTKGESRVAFIRRVLLGETPSEETQAEQQEDAA